LTLTSALAIPRRNNMGQNAVYIAVDQQTLDTLWALEDQEFRDHFVELEENETFKRVDIGKTWDALHCTLTGISASDPIEDNPLSEGIVGVNPKIFEDDDYSVFVSVTYNGELAKILGALDAITPDRLFGMLNTKKLKSQNVYPTGIWNDPPTSLAKELSDELTSLRQFYRESLESGLHVLSTIM
jgi:hypothetical protein